MTPVAPEATGSPMAYAFEDDGSQHVVYRTNSDHIHELYWKASNGWRQYDLSVATEPDAPLPAGMPSAFVLERDPSQHVLYRAGDNHIHELYWKSGQGWRHVDLSVAVDGTTLLAAEDPEGYAFESNFSQHVIYRAVSNEVQELYWKGKTFWQKLADGFVAVLTAIVDFFVTVISFVLEVIESIFVVTLNLVAFIVDLIFSIPFVGRVLKFIWNAVLTVVWAALSVFDYALALVGVYPQKKLRDCIHILSDENGPLDTVENVVSQIQTAIDIFLQQANVKIIPSRMFRFDNAFAASHAAEQNWVDVLLPSVLTDQGLDVDCNGGAFAEDLGVTRSAFQMLINTRCFYSSFRRLIGYGAPVAIFVVRSISGGKTGCSLGPLTDYITLHAGHRPDSRAMAHELGHACNLLHFQHPDFLMDPGAELGTEIRASKLRLLRASRHVTYF